MDSIWFGNLRFTTPIPVETAWAPHVAGVCAVLLRNWRFQPAPYEPLCFRGCTNLNEYVSFWRRHRSPGHPPTRDPGSGLYVAYCLLVDRSRSHRDQVEARLIEHYHPRLSLAPWFAEAKALAAVAVAGRS